MSEWSGHEPGAPCWAELSSTDVTLSVRFYREVFGWEAVFDPRPESGGRGRFTLDGRVVAGVGPGDGLSCAWNTYVAVADAAAATARARAAGGAVVLEPAPVLDEGIAATVRDSAGACLILWQAVRHAGAEVVGEAGTLAWSELVTGETAVREDFFYRAVFDWTVKDAGGYGWWCLHGRPVAGLTGPEPLAHWRSCFAVSRLDAAVARAAELGARVLVPPSMTPQGLRAVLADPQSAVFGLVEAARG
ncbi:VOC family protein [Streptosporangium saharense]|uniref:VOC domain-containing protein n=1 Tax=Streptosporangium saharense TaxID=1706840 RepID=A0A7W7QTI3_9ACTN|nr:VOC family protein [Streptosporangium saharense]MBB4919492.1 hypothetical protein [Streptosporangium saharense]